MADAREWSSIIVAYLENTTLQLSTKWQGGKIYYHFNIAGYPAPVRKVFNAGAAFMEDKSFSIVFLDQSGFKLHTIKIPLRSLEGAATKEGEVSGLSINDNMYMSADEYRQIAAWSVSWSL